MHHRIANRRKDFHLKTAHKLCDQAPTIFAEDLNVKFSTHPFKKIFMFRVFCILNGCHKVGVPPYTTTIFRGAGAFPFEDALPLMRF